MTRPQPAGWSPIMRPLWRAANLGICLLLVALSLSCAVGRGEGEVTSDHLFVEGCVDGPFDLRPDFFASNPHLDTQMIAIQHGDKMQDLSDGVSLVVYETSTIVDNFLGQPLDVRLPAGITPPGQAVTGREQALVGLTLYLNDSCHEQNVSLQAISGTVTFSELFSGDLSDRKRSDRLIEGEFDVVVADPRLLPVDGSDPDPAIVSSVTGNFSFYFRRGSGAQPFP